MQTPRISASSYSNTAPLIWSFLYGAQRGNVEIILDNAPARSAELLAQNRVDAALVPVIAYHELDDVRLVPGVCVGAKEKVKSVCLITRDKELSDVRSVALDVSSRTSVILTKIIFREFLGFEPEWRDAEPNIDTMLETSDCALLIGDPALLVAKRPSAECGLRSADLLGSAPIADKDVERLADPEPDNDSNSAVRTPHSAFGESEIRNPKSEINKYDLAELWKQHTGLGFIFAMWMTRAKTSPVDFAAARNEGLARIDEIVSNYLPDIKIGEEDLRNYLSRNISYAIDEDLQAGMELYFDLAKKHFLCENIRELRYTN